LFNGSCALVSACAKSEVTDFGDVLGELLLHAATVAAASVHDAMTNERIDSSSLDDENVRARLEM
jgi:hypothetical protein